MACSKLQTAQKLNVEVYRLADFRNFYEFIGSMGARRLTRTDFNGREGHQSLVAERRRTERLFTHSLNALNEWVVRRNSR